jgi:molybdopterin/thiamine biosynthesis adenylyltransferase
MKYTITFSEEIYRQLTNHLFSNLQVEQAAYGLCRISSNDEEIRLLVRTIIPVVEQDIINATKTSMSIKSQSFLRAMKEADVSKQVFVFIHSHPTGFEHHSSQDDKEERMLFRTAYNRIATKGVHASIVFSSPNKPVGRVWLANSSVEPVSTIRVIGNRFTFYLTPNKYIDLPAFFDRQVRAFGPEIQRLLLNLHIGLVGSGGTGSAVAEQLIRLGVGRITVSDGQKFEKTNVNRVYGSRVTDDEHPKVEIIARQVKDLGLGTIVDLIDAPITYRSVINKFKSCDIIFGCTDDHWGRSILNRLAVYYGIPVFDMGVKIDSENGKIKSIQGRVTTLLWGYACLFCRERIDSNMVAAESREALDPEANRALREEGYAPELEDAAPSVIPFTTMVASLAISEFLHRLTGFMGSERLTNEVIIRFDESDIKRNSRISKVDCYCGDSHYFGRGDTNPLLDMVWRPEK